MAASGLRPCAIFPALLSVGVWTMPVQCGWSSSPDQLGIVLAIEPLPHQQTNPIWASDGRGPGPLFGLATLVEVLATVSSSYPLHQAVSQTLLTRPPLVSQSSKLLPVTTFDLHVGLPPAFNLSHDQTLQFKSLMLNKINFVIITCSLLRHGIHFRPRTLRIMPSVPTQVSDKLLREQCRFAFSQRRGVCTYYAFSRSSVYFRFLREFWSEPR